MNQFIDEKGPLQEKPLFAKISKNFLNIAVFSLFGIIFAYALIVGLYWYFSSDRPTAPLDQFFRYGNYAARFVGGFCVPAFVYFGASIYDLIKDDTNVSKTRNRVFWLGVVVWVLLTGCSIFLNLPLVPALIIGAIILFKGKTPWAAALSYPAAAIMYEAGQAYMGNRSWQVFFDLFGFGFFYTSRLYIEQRILDFTPIVLKHPKFSQWMFKSIAIVILVLLVSISLAHAWFTHPQK